MYSLKHENSVREGKNLDSGGLSWKICGFPSIGVANQSKINPPSEGWGQGEGPSALTQLASS